MEIIYAYCIVGFTSIDDLERRVDTMIKLEGWIPQGGVSVVNGRDAEGATTHCFYQAMIRYEKH